MALIPPVSGGGEPDSAPEEAYFQITDAPLDVTALHELVLRPAAGAVSVFSGVVRDNNRGGRWITWNTTPTRRWRRR